MDDITKEFLVEGHENLDQMERDLVKLEEDPHSKEALGSIFRTIHALKGSSGFLGFGQMEAVAHVGENLLGKLRDGVLTVNPEITSGLLATVDAVRFTVVWDKCAISAPDAIRAECQAFEESQAWLFAGSVEEASPLLTDSCRQPADA